MDKLYHTIKLAAFTLIIIVASLWLLGFSCQVGLLKSGKMLPPHLAQIGKNVMNKGQNLVDRIEGGFESGVHDLEHGASVIGHDLEHGFEEARDWVEEQI